MKLIATAVLAAILGAAAAHRVDSYIVSTVLHSEDHSIYRNVEQANALLDMWERGILHR